MTPAASASGRTASTRAPVSPALDPELLRIIKALAEGAARRDYAAATERAAHPKD